MVLQTCATKSQSGAQPSAVSILTLAGDGKPRKPASWRSGHLSPPLSVELQVADKEGPRKLAWTKATGRHGESEGSRPGGSRIPAQRSDEQHAEVTGPAGDRPGDSWKGSWRAARSCDGREAKGRVTMAPQPLRCWLRCTDAHPHPTPTRALCEAPPAVICPAASLVMREDFKLRI